MPVTYRLFSIRISIQLAGLMLITCLSLRAATVNEDSSDPSGAGVEQHLIEYQLKTELITWLTLNSQNEISHIKEKLTLNRNLERKTCNKPITFSFTSASKRMIKVECENNWRRFVKKPSWINVKNPEEKKINIETQTIINAFILNRDIKKEEEITLQDLTRNRISVKDTTIFLQDLNVVAPMVSSRVLRSGDPLLITDVISGQVVLIARIAIPSGSSLTNEVATFDTRFSDVPTDALKKMKGWDFMELNRNIMAGEILRQRHLRKAKLVRRDDPITIVSKSASLEILTSGTSLQDGYYGQRVRVVNLESGRSIIGIVTGRGKVEITNN